MSETFPGVARRRRLTAEDFKRDCVRINPLSNARTALLRVDHLKGNDSEHPHFRVGYRSPWEYMRHFNKRVRSNGVNSLHRKLMIGNTLANAWSVHSAPLEQFRTSLFC
jgi:hypothetical protein